MLRILSAVLLITISSNVALAQQSNLAVIAGNDNRTPAGVYAQGELSLNLIAETGIWYPGGEDNYGIEIQAFREQGGELSTPGPLIRVETGTTINATVRNNIANSELQVHGLSGNSAGEERVLTIAEGEESVASFVLNEPGVYFYWGSTVGRTLNQRRGIDSQLNGVIVVEDESHPIQGEILVLGEILELNPNGPNDAQFSINGRSWPNTERYEVETNQSSRWHIVNPTFGGHPMHLHGFHYRVSAEGSSQGYRTVPSRDQREVVTEVVPSGGVRTIDWLATEPGNWLFHCHIVAHVAASNNISVRGYDSNNYDPETMPHMSGMVVGIKVKGESLNNYSELVTQRKLDFVLESRSDFFELGQTAIGISVNEEGSKENLPSTPGPTIFLNKGETVAINVQNKLDEATSIHWHGMELESFYDGVAGFSGLGNKLAQEIPPGGSFQVLMTPPKAGTYLYHTHMRDEEQLAAGLYGAIIVSDPSEPYEPEYDRLFVLGLLGENNPQGLRLPGPKLGINGSTAYGETFEVGKEYRLRIINIADNNGGFAVWLHSNRGFESWIPIAKDGAELPESLQHEKIAQRQQVSVGEAYDFRWTPQNRGIYWLEVRRGGNNESMAAARLQVN